MLKRLSIICLLVVMLFTSTSCARLSFSDRLDCTKYCTVKNCVGTRSITTTDEFGNPVIIEQSVVHSGCIYKCSRECEFCRSEMVKEWKRNKNKVIKPNRYKDVVGDNLR